MVRIILERHLGDVIYNIAVPDSASLDDELDVIIHQVRYYLDKAAIAENALKTLEELAEDDPNIRYVLKNEFIGNILEHKASIYSKIAIDLLVQASKRYELKNIIKKFSNELSNLMTKPIDSIINNIVGTDKTSDSVVKDEGEEDSTAEEG